MSRSRVVGYRRALAWMGVSGVLTAAGLLAGACGARSELEHPADTGVQPSALFCAEESYRGGFDEVSIYVLLDSSASMVDADKWSQASAALDAFAHDPAMAGVGMGLQLFPRGSSCDPEHYALPVVPIAPLPDNADVITATLAAQSQEGQTPTAPVLAGAITYARALRLAEPTLAVVIALVTDGAPNACESTTENVASIARHGADVEPQILTYVISLKTGYLQALGQIAAAGGTGAPIVVDDSGTAQQLVDALGSLREDFQTCRYAVPPVAGVQPLPTDISVEVSTGGEPAALPRVAGEASCAGGGFWLDDPVVPTQARLCPASCAAVHQAAAEAEVVVRTGCGKGSSPTDAGVADGGSCGGAVPFSCLPACGEPSAGYPDCVGGLWICPAGTVASSSCSQCDPVPHGCCGAGGSLAAASCIDGIWVCPPGTVIFGSPGCSPPEICAATLPCPSGDFCEVADFSCGSDDLLGQCQTKPSSCSPGGPAVCGCNGVTYPSLCEAELAGQHATKSLSCPTPAGTFRCGPLFCGLGGEICRRTVDLVGGGPDAYACVGLPPGCPSGCGCGLCEPCPGQTCGEACSSDGSGGLVLTCTVL